MSNTLLMFHQPVEYGKCTRIIDDYDMVAAGSGQFRAIMRKFAIPNLI